MLCFCLSKSSCSGWRTCPVACRRWEGTRWEGRKPVFKVWCICPLQQAEWQVRQPVRRPRYCGLQPLLVECLVSGDGAPSIHLPPLRWFGSPTASEGHAWLGSSRRGRVGWGPIGPEWPGHGMASPSPAGPAFPALGVHHGRGSAGAVLRLGPGRT